MVDNAGGVHLLYSFSSIDPHSYHSLYSTGIHCKDQPIQKTGIGLYSTGIHCKNQPIQNTGIGLWDYIVQVSAERINLYRIQV